jgi:thymidylate synthase (FAD)
MEPGYEIKCLDHGYVRFIESMGSDEGIVEAARMSTGRGFVSWERYLRCKKCDQVRNFRDAELPCVLTDVSVKFDHDWQDFPRGYMNKHSTPFEFADLHIEVQAPLMVYREWHRHRQQSYSEFSARYSQMPDLHYLPNLERIQAQSKINRQGSGEALVEHQAQSVVDGFRLEQQQVYLGYDTLVKAGVAKEIARINTPVSRYSKMRAKTDLRNWFGFLQLRMAPSAQWEIRQYANAVAEIVKALFPRTYALFEEHDLHGVRLSRTEVAVLRKLLGYEGTADITISNKDRDAIRKKVGA